MADETRRSLWPGDSVLLAVKEVCPPSEGKLGTGEEFPLQSCSGSSGMPREETG